MAKKSGWSRKDGLTVQVQTPAIQIQESPIQRRRLGTHWPDGESMPEWYERRLIPCPKCRRVRLDNGGQSTVGLRTGEDVAYLRCKACGYSWKLPIKKESGHDKT